MGWWFLVTWLDAGVPASINLYVGGDQQRCLQIASEHLEAEQMRPGHYIEVIYIGCVQGSAPRRL
jgi:hypothetical protein